MSDFRRLALRVAPALFVAVLAAAWLIDDPPWVRLAPSDNGAATRVETVLDGLSDEPIILVGFDPDLGTYAEIRATTRALLADLLSRGGRLALVSLTPEGRALASAELVRLESRAGEGAELVDLGFIPGAEAGLVDLVGEVAPLDSAGSLARTLAAQGTEAVDAIVVIGGNDLGPRSWVEQVLPRVGAVTTMAVTPTVLLPEVDPYRATGQLDAVLGTPGEGAAYRSGLALGRFASVADASEPSVLPLLIGLLIALAVLGTAVGTRLFGPMPPATGREDAG